MDSLKKILVLFVVLFMVAGTAHAGFTTVSGAGEVRVNQLLDGIYGETFMPNAGPDGNSSYTSSNAPGAGITVIVAETSTTKSLKSRSVRPVPF